MKYWLSLIMALLALPAYAYDDAGLYANFKRAGLDLGTSKVSNYREYEDSPNTEINQNTQGVLKGVFEFALEYEQPKYRFDNMLYAEYGKSRIHGNRGNKKYTENADKLLLTSEYIYKIWHFANKGDLGPLANVAYQTEFTSDSQAKRQQVARAMQGLKMVNGVRHLTDFHLAMVEEFDLTYARAETKTAGQIGFTYKYPFAGKYRFEFESYYRRYLGYSHYEATDFRYEFSAIGKLNIMVAQKFFVEPYVSYFRAEDRKHNKSGANLMFGVAVAFTDVVKMF